jgi:microsomal dipeptidase-like Zn-dependent dipeptidase
MGIEHVGLGADVIDQVIEAEIAAGHPLDPVTIEAMAARGGRLGLVGFLGPDDYPALVDVLRGRGYDGADLDAILRGNFLRVFEHALPQ